MDFGFSFIFVYVTTYLFIALFCGIVLMRLGADLGREQEVRYFKLLTWALILYCIFESFWAVGNFGGNTAINRFNLYLTIINSILVNTICYVWYCYIESYLRSSVIDRKLRHMVASIPFVAAIILSVTTVWTHAIFFITPEGTAARGPLYVSIIVLGYVYAVVATLRCIVAAAKAQTRNQRSELVTLAAFAVPPALMGIVDTLVPMMPIAAPAFFTSVLVVFTMLQEAQISHDALTGLNNRRRADRYLDDALGAASPDDPLVYYVLDINAFKGINDTYGHLEGDRALCTLADSLKMACSDSRAFVARWGGDEFIVVAQQSEVGTPETLIAKMRATLAHVAAERSLPYDLTISVGYALCTSPDYTKQDLLDAADRMLYDEKDRLKRAQA